MASLDTTDMSEQVLESSDATESHNTLSPLLKASFPSDHIEYRDQTSPIRGEVQMSLPRSPSDVALIQHENKMLKQKLKQLQTEYQAEQGKKSVITLFWAVLICYSGIHTPCCFFLKHFSQHNFGDRPTELKFHICCRFTKF